VAEGITEAVATERLPDVTALRTAMRRVVLAHGFSAGRCGHMSHHHLTEYVAISGLLAFISFGAGGNYARRK